MGRPSKEWIDREKGLQANVNQIEKQMNFGRVVYPEMDQQRVDNLKEAQDLTRNNPDYFRSTGGGPYNRPAPGRTWCNSATQDTSAATGVDMKKIVDSQGRYENSANEMVDAMDASVEKGDLVQVDGKTAQELANLGATVIAGWKNPNGINGVNGNKGESGHVATVRPTNTEYDASKGPLISNVGWNNKVEHVNDGFGVGKSTSDVTLPDNMNDVKYYYDPDQKNIYDKDRINEKP